MLTVATRESHRPQISTPARSWATLRRAWLASYLAVWTVTLLGALATALAGDSVTRMVRGSLGLTLSAASNPPASVARILALAAHNIPICCWPLLLPLLGVHEHRMSRLAADLLLAGCLLVNVLPVAAAIGSYGTPLLAFIVQLPVEWAALALGASSWVAARRLPLSVRQVAVIFTLACVLLLAAAVLEVAGVPHR